MIRKGIYTTKTEKVDLEVEILDERKAYGRDEVLITYHGKQFWVTKNKVKNKKLGAA